MNPSTVQPLHTTTINPTEQRWFSANPDKAWVEKFNLVYSPIWMTLVGIVMLTGLAPQFGELEYNLFGLLVFFPFVIGPWLLQNRHVVTRSLDWTNRYWIKSNLYIGSFVFFCSYFGTEYFFDVLGMVYDYPMIKKTNFDSALLGSGKQQVPLVMYVLAHAYFMTYHTTAVLVLRRIRHSALPFKKILWPIMIFVVAYFWAWMETKAMANHYIKQQFYYQDIPRMLAYGSMMYAFDFIPSFPIYYFIDENPLNRQTLWMVFMGSCTASVLALYLFDFATHIIGKIY